MQAKRIPTGVKVRHSRECISRTQRDRASHDRDCDCDPTYEAWVYNPRDKRKLTKSFRGKGALTAAKQWRADAGSNMRRGQLLAPVRESLEDAAREWLSKCERGEILSRYRRPYSPAALRGYRHDLETYVLPDFGARRLSDVTADDLQSLVDRLVGEGLSGQKVRNVITPVQSLYRRNRRRVLVDPTDGLDLPEPAGRRERAATPREATELLGCLPESDLALWATAFYAGLRRGELRALRVRNLRGLDGEGVAAISVEHSWDDVEGERAPKSVAGVREVPIPNTLRVILAAHVKRTKRKGDDLVFGRTGSVTFSPTLVRRRAARAWAVGAVGAFLTGKPFSVELTPIAPHECRHSYSSYLDAAGISETRADRYMGHANASVQARYRHQLDGQLAEDAATLEAYLSGTAAGKVVLLSATA